MQAEPGHTTDTREIPKDHSFNIKQLEHWLSVNVSGFAGPLYIEMFKGGQSNPTYKLITQERIYVMRAKPGPIARLLPSAHAIEREYRVMSALQQTPVPVAETLALCEDESVIGRAFYIMAFLPGRVLWDQALPDMSPEKRRSIYLEMNKVLATLHVLAPSELDLSDFGKPGNYFQRQIGRWTKQYQSSITDPIPEMDKLIDWLPNHIPESARTELKSIVHGDFRLDNVMFHPTETKAIAVLDWELSTIGHPLADFSYHCMSWHIAPGVFRGIKGLDLKMLGIPDEDEYIRLYCEKTKFITPEALKADWNFYLAYNMFRLAAILQGIAKRAQTGTASSVQANQSAAGAKPMAELAWKLAQLSQDQ